MNIAYDAMVFAREVHKNQKRKYTGNPYFDHLAEVAGITASVLLEEKFIAIAWLHDCIEDCKITYNELFDKFGKYIADGVLILSDLEEGKNRAERKEKSRTRLSLAFHEIQTIKVADLISNTSSIVELDKDFSKVYLKEKELLLDVMQRADSRLVKIAREQINKE